MSFGYCSQWTGPMSVHSIVERRVNRIVPNMFPVPVEAYLRFQRTVQQHNRCARRSWNLLGRDWAQGLLEYPERGRLIGSFREYIVYGSRVHPSLPAMPATHFSPTIAPIQGARGCRVFRETPSNFGIGRPGSVLDRYSESQSDCRRTN